MCEKFANDVVDGLDALANCKLKRGKKLESTKLTSRITVGVFLCSGERKTKELKFMLE